MERVGVYSWIWIGDVMFDRLVMVLFESCSVWTLFFSPFSPLSFLEAYFSFIFFISRVTALYDDDDDDDDVMTPP